MTAVDQLASRQVIKTEGDGSTTPLSRKQRLRTLEKEIRSGMEEWYYTGQKLKETQLEDIAPGVAEQLAVACDELAGLLRS